MNEDTNSLLVGIFFLGLVAVGIFWFFGGEEEGVIDTSDCRASYEVEDEIWNRIFHKYTCDYVMTNNDEIMTGTCSRAEITSTNECKAEYYYYKKPFKYCTEDFPWMDYDGKCWSDYGNYGAGGQTYVGYEGQE